MNVLVWTKLSSVQNALENACANLKKNVGYRNVSHLEELEAIFMAECCKIPFNVTL